MMSNWVNIRVLRIENKILRTSAFLKEERNLFISFSAQKKPISTKIVLFA